jgi:hypothetical protein
MNAAVAFAVLSISISVIILARGRFYHWLKPESRPRRWVLFSMLVLFGIFLIWFALWMLLPQSVITRAITLVFGVTFFVIATAIKWFIPLVDRFVKRRGWSLR